MGAVESSVLEYICNSIKEMKVDKRMLSRMALLTAGIAVLVCCGSVSAFPWAEFGQESPQGNVAVTVENFGKVNEHIYRGSQPTAENYRQLAAFGIRTVLDLRGDSESDSKDLAERAGLRYINLPLEPKQYPQPGAAQRFLEIVNDQSSWPIYVHCAGGRHRTGAMIAVYRITVDGWDFDRTYREMKDYGFYTKLGHGCYRDYVNDYYRNWQAYHQTSGVVGPPAANKMTRFTKATRLDMMTGVVERPLKRVYKARPIFKDR
jgi:protein tyrosine/serine phosphatase